MTWKKRIAWIVVALLAAGAIVLAAIPKPVPVEVARAARGPLRVTADASGRTRVVERFAVSAPVSGQLARVTLRAGDRVEAGQAIASIAPIASPLIDARTRDQFTAELAAARAAEAEAAAAAARARVGVDQARRDLARAEALSATGAIAASGLEDARFAAAAREAEVRAAEAAVGAARRRADVARAMLGQGGVAPAGAGVVEVAAPARGSLLRVFRESAGPVAAGEPLFEVGEPSRLEVVVDMLTSEAVAVRPGARADLVRWGGAGVAAGKVARVEPSAVTKISALGVEEQRVNVVIVPDDAPAEWAAVGDAFRVEARVVVWESADVLKVPLAALFRQGAEWAVYAAETAGAADRGGTARLKAVRIGRRGADEAEVVSGLAAGDAVVVYPGDRVADGVKVSW
ncbi:MAG: biotin/lipoyl-binding protein [Deltaproteobacteria bacterium]|nr:biotin/lipoyl-binding protein [Deltaproteobacteria bacterium]